MKKYKDFILLIILTMGSQALIYYLIKLFITDYRIINSFLSVPLIKPFIYFYDSWYPFIIICAFLVYKNSKDTFRYLIATMLLTALMAQITFIIYPSMVVRPDIEVHSVTDWLINFTYKGDNPPVNCLPSMHCFYCFITSYYILKCKNLKNKWLVVGYSMLIVLSTLFVKQHVVEDVLLALIYTAFAILIVHVNKDRIINTFKKVLK